MTNGPLGVNDNGKYLTGIAANASTGIIEYRQATPHNLRTGQTITLGGSSTIAWSSSGVRPIANNTIGPIWVTDPYTIATLMLTSGTGGSASQTPTNISSEIAVTVPWSLVAPAVQDLPYDFTAAQCANWTNTADHCNVPWASSDSTIAAIGTAKPQNLGPTNLLLMEMGNEHWNQGGAGLTEFIYESVMSVLPHYMPVGTSLYPHFTPTGSVASYVTTGTAFPQGPEGMFALRTANRHYILTNAFAAAGGNPANVKVVYGSQYTTIPTTQISTILAYNLPQHYMAFAPYLGLDNAQSTAFMQPAGYAANASNANYPVSFLNESVRYHVFYGSEAQSYYQALNQAFAGTTLRPMAYEGALSVIAAGIPFLDQIKQDALYHPSFRDAIYAWYVGLQQGNINVSHSGTAFASYFQMYNVSREGFLWKLAGSLAMPPGAGHSNEFVTPQAAAPGNGNTFGFEQTNQSTGLQGLVDWINGGIPTVSSISGVSPTAGTTAGGTLVTVTGAGFTGATAVHFGTNLGTSLTVVNSTTITILSPAGTGTVNVTVTTPAGTSPTSPTDQFTYGVVVTGISPTSGPIAGGTPVTITGVIFTGASAANFGSTPGTSMVVVNDNSITVNRPAESAGVVDVTVVTPGGTSATSPADQFTFTSPSSPAVTGISPTTAPNIGGTPVSLTGSGFTGATLVKFANLAATFVIVVSDSHITCVTPSHPLGAFHTTVTTPQGTSPKTSADLITFFAVPVVSQISSKRGPTAGGTTISITGAGFTGATTVSFGATPGTGLVVISDTLVTIVSPPGASGAVQITVTTPNGTSAATGAARRLPMRSRRLAADVGSPVSAGPQRESPP